MDYSENYNLKLPNGTDEFGDDADINDLNENFVVIDGALKSQADYIDNKELENSITLTAAGWSSTAPYTQTASISGITADSLPDKVLPVYSDTLATAILQHEAYNVITYYDTGTDQITFTCLEEVPTIDLPLLVIGV